MAYKDLRHFIDVLEQEGELVRIKEFVDPHLEITDVYDRIIKHKGPALLFENTGTDFPLLINAMGTEHRMCKVLGVDNLDDISAEIESLFKDLMGPKDNLLDKLRMLPKLGRVSSWMPKVISGRGKCQEIIMDPPDITKFPIQTCWPEDGGPFLTFPIIHTKDPNSGIRNVGLYRMQVFGPTLTAMHWHKHKVSAHHFQQYKKLGKIMPVAVALGGDPVYTYGATAPMPENIDEYMLAGFLRKKKVKLVKCITQDVYVPEDAEIIIEGFIDPEEEYILEGPFGDHTGYYSLEDYYPKFNITAITHRRNAIYPATVVGIPPQEDAWIGKATERIFVAPIKMTMLPEIKDMELPIEGIFHNITIVKIEKTFSAHAQKVMNAMWGAGQMMLNKMLIIVDGDIDIHDYKVLAKHISDNIDPETDIYFSHGPMDVLDHSCSVMSLGGKMCIDATVKNPEELRGESRIENNPAGIKLDTKKLMETYPDITAINTTLLELGISLVIVAVYKDRPEHIQQLTESLFNESGFAEVKMIIFVEHTVDISYIGDVVWRFTNNIDPRRDSLVIKARDKNSISHIGLDGTRKTRKYDGFKRDWPNILVMDKETIATIDQKWDKLGLGKFLESPSVRYSKQLYKGGAVVEE
ncbi:MAG: menaquinone biosynthesis decarboxylase [Bacteroidetes bacterium]|nr:menaquinone biosynthesis decarboxylase [Bacteroidota bacterium]